MQAEAYGILNRNVHTTVAVKMVKENPDITCIKALISELKIMVHLGKHLNIANLLGACTQNIAKRELLIIFEYSRFGNVHDYLLRHRDSYINQVDPITKEIDWSIGSDIIERAGAKNCSRYVLFKITNCFSNLISIFYANRIRNASVSFSHTESMVTNSGGPGYANVDTRQATQSTSRNSGEPDYADVYTSREELSMSLNSDGPDYDDVDTRDTEQSGSFNSSETDYADVDTRTIDGK